MNEDMSRATALRRARGTARECGRLYPQRPACIGNILDAVGAHTDVATLVHAESVTAVVDLGFQRLDAAMTHDDRLEAADMFRCTVDYGFRTYEEVCERLAREATDDTLSGLAGYFDYVQDMNGAGDEARALPYLSAAMEAAGRPLPPAMTPLISPASYWESRKAEE